MVSALFSAAALASCTPAHPTEIIVVIDIEPSLGGRLDGLDVDMRDPSYSTFGGAVALAELAGALPTLAFRHRGGPTGPMEVTVHAWSASIDLVQNVTTSFVPGEQRVLYVSLHEACIGVNCDPRACTGAGTCTTDERPGTSLPRLADVLGPTADAGTGDAPRGPERCVYGWTCTNQTDRCLLGECVPGGLSVGTECVSDEDCESGACIGEAGDVKRCVASCITNDACPTGRVCVGEAGTGHDGVCLSPLLSPCMGCDEPTSVCVRDLTTEAPMCIPGPFCVSTLECSSGLDCAMVIGSSGGQATCAATSVCLSAELRIFDASLSIYCSNKSTCHEDADCSGLYTECLDPALLGSPQLDGLGICVRQI